MNANPKHRDLAHFVHAAKPGETFSLGGGGRISTFEVVRRHDNSRMPGESDTLELTETTTRWDDRHSCFTVRQGMAIAWLGYPSAWDPTADLQSLPPLQRTVQTTPADVATDQQMLAIHFQHARA
ncbi:hypothetical protein JRG18_12540 [Kocuria palustris]|uniref:hypothetical protein n=1 Tax=Kocuria palustris TaxID=71999 RepID=UPI0019D1ED71|nr:hypothetical protein [Kocuria palustris]MBN6754344.1 hypothetical protein [Kocuria palustris]MBN6759281.1 hypothetical protein [Kocuria palustris]MBN6764325.1 hypothetical protein [Kocuria palustris]MBN6783792.1 hypothetical protein [Kocuria palustris]MBN6800292.1 hypothetical protein [Kocuria palustris]